MNTDLKLVIDSTSSKTTEQIGQTLGGNLRGGEILELISDLGGGKTTFTRGLVQGLGSKDIVASPTFTVSKVYEAGDITVHHFDFYRLAEPGIMAYDIQDIIKDPKNIVVIEWADIVRDVLPNKTVKIYFEYSSEMTRKISILYNQQQKYIVKGLLR